MIRFLPLGGAQEIGANSFYLYINGVGIILDSGIHPQKSGIDSLPLFDLLTNFPLDYVLISHAHQDHLGSLPFLIKKFPYLKIVATPQTRALAELTLHNSVAILKEQVNEDNSLHTGSKNRFEVYSHEEIDLLIQSINYKAYKEEFFISGYNGNELTKITFYDAGHILGSAGILIEGEKNIFYSGDINLSDQPLIKGADLPDKKIDILILESTYGGTDSSSLNEWDKEADRLASAINKIFGAGGSVLIPVFSIGKTQEMLKTLWNMMQKGKLVNGEIYTGGLGVKINKVYDYNRYTVNMNDPEFELSSIPQKNFYEVDDLNSFFKTPCIVLASSGMMIEGTASYKLAQRWIRQKNSAIFTVGFMEESTPGYLFANAMTGDKIKLPGYENEEEIKCRIEKFRFTSHSKREELLDIVKKLKPENVILVHGDNKAIDWIGANILKNLGGVKVFKAENKSEILLD